MDWLFWFFIFFHFVLYVFLSLEAQTFNSLFIIFEFFYKGIEIINKLINVYKKKYLILCACEGAFKRISNKSLISLDLTKKKMKF